MKKYLLIAFVLVLLFISGCQVRKTGEAKRVVMAATPTPTESPPPSGLSVNVNRALICGETTTVNLDISTSGLNSNEIIVIVDRVPGGTTYVTGSASTTPDYILDNKLVWLFAKNPPKTTLQGQGREVTQSIPTRISYNVSGNGTSGFRGKWSLETANKDGLIGGKSYIATCSGALPPPPPPP